MKANFALMLSFEGLRLLHRANGGWQSVGSVQFEDADLDAQLSTLRRTALGLAPGGMRAKLVLPNDQLKYLRVETGDVDLEERIAIVRDALEAATPYTIDELQFDIAPAGPVTYAAAVARETLNEAEDFTVRHRLGPICWVGQPNPEDFPGEPFFGATVHAATLLAPGERVEPDGDPVRLFATPGTALAGLEISEFDAASDMEDDDTGFLEDEYDEESSILADVVAQTPEIRAQSTVPLAPQVDASFAYPGVFASRRDADLPDPPADAGSASTLDAVAADAEMAKSGRRTGIVLAGLAITALAALALWSILADRVDERSVRTPVATGSLDDGEPAVPVTAADTLVLPDPAPVAATAPDAEISQTSPRPLGLRSGTDEFALVSLPSPLELPAPVPAVGDAPRAAPAPQASTQFDRETAMQFYGRTGIWTIPPEKPDHGPQVPLDDFYLTSIDPPNLALDAIALRPEDAFRVDDALPVPNNPAAPGAQFALDQRGLVEATPDGTLSPDGILIYAGRPPAVPPATPDRPDEEPGLSVANDIALKGVRARLRPSDFGVAIERQQLGGLSRNELAGFRPRPRPEAPKLAEEADTTPTARATALSRRPATRPGGFGDTVARILAARTLTPSQDADGNTVEVAAVATPRNVAPQIPSTASVARQATVRNAINLKRLSLMGVYGTPSDRRALVRLPSGRYKKVEIGDRLDGGRVSAIEETELRYRKGSRDMVLKMPKI